ncbi:MAG: AmmeMemoRadiSam system protein B [Patescibacteria group bacterium]
MSLVFAAITPHSPLLLPSIGKDAIKKIDHTRQALEKLSEDLYISHPDIIIIISPHGQQLADAFAVNTATKYECDLKQFGDLATRINFNGEILLPTRVHSAACKNHDCHTVLINEPKLDHGAVVPLFYLAKHLPEVKIMPISFSELDAKTHLEFGTMLKEQIMDSNKRVAVIASGDLSHALTNDAPAGFNKNGVVFDKKIQELLVSHNTAGLLALPKDMVSDAAECGLRSFLILMGILRDINYRYESYAYEAPFGIGYLTANFIL